MVVVVVVPFVDTEPGIHPRQRAWPPGGSAVGAVCCAVVLLGVKEV